MAAELTAWIATVLDDAVISLPSGACYRIDTTVLVQRRTNLLLEGNGATLQAVTEGNRTRSHLRIVSSSNVTVHNLIVRGANPSAGIGEQAYKRDREAQHAYEIFGSTGVLLDNVQAYDVFGDFVYVGGPMLSKSVTVRNSRFERNGRQGIAITNGEDILIEANFIGDVRRSLIDLEPNNDAGRALRVRILSNRTGPVRNFWLASKGRSSDIGEVIIRRNIMEAPSGGLMWVRTPTGLAPRKSFDIDNNSFLARNSVSDEGSVGAFFFQNCADIRITQNVVKFEPGGSFPAVELRSTSRVAILDNSFDGASQGVMADAESTEVRQS